jgi:predicted DNA binding CopG/RHH family protein
MGKRIPKFKSDEEVEKFLEQDLSDYLDPENLQPIRFEFQPKDTQVNLRLSKGLLQALKAHAAAKGISYQKFIRMTLEHAISKPTGD